MKISHREAELLAQIEACRRRIHEIHEECRLRKPGSEGLAPLQREAAEQARWLELYSRELTILRASRQPQK